MTHFTVLHRNGKARIGRLHTPHGIIETPFFMPAATKATGKVITTDDYQNLTGNQNKDKGSDKDNEPIKVKALISNSLILSLEPGAEVIQAAGGLHKFMNFQGVIFTDCGGFQISRNMFEKKSKRDILIDLLNK